MFVNILSCILSEETLHQSCVPPTLVLETSEDPGSLKAMWPSGPMPPMNSSIPPAWGSIEKQSSFSFYVLINNKKETSPQQSSVRSQHTPRLNQERCRPERARSRKVLVQSQKSHFTFGSMSMCLKKFCNMYLWYFVWSYQFFCQKLLVVALRVIFRDADVLVHVERLHVLEAHFSSLVRLRETCGDGNIIILIAHLDQFLIHPKRSSSCIKGIMSTWTSLVLMSLFSK